MSLRIRPTMSVAILLLAFQLASPLAAQAQTRIRVGTCARTLTAGVGAHDTTEHGAPGHARLRA
jgi:hypothetical protein